MTTFRTALFLALAGTVAASAGARLNREEGARAHWHRLAAGDQHTCAILDDGTAHCWGENQFGEAGDGTSTTPKRSPVAVISLGTVVSIAAGTSHTCALTIYSTVSCWGSNSAGQLGNTGGNSSTPVAVQGLNDVVAIGAVSNHTCAVLVGGTVWCWGAIPADGTFTNTFAPKQALGVSGAVAVVVGVDHTCALLVNGSVQCWGANGGGELGNNSSIDFSSAPVVVSPFSGPAGATAVDISANFAFTCVRLSDGSVNCWGVNVHGVFGNGASGSGVFSNHPVASNVSAAVVALGTASTHTCAILVDGTVECWGDDDKGQLGDGGTSAKASPGPAVPNVSNAVEIALGFGHTCARIVDGTIKCWGSNQFGQHGNGNTSPAGTDSVSGISGTVSARGVSAGSEFTCARRGTGAVACWGTNGIGQLGQPAPPFSSSNPLAVPGLTNVIALSSGDGHACAVDSTGLAKCWGGNFKGQLGAGGIGNTSTHPVTVTSSAPFIAISAGFAHTCGVTVGGLVRCWGFNGSGQLGTGDQNTSFVSVQVFGMTNAVAVAVGNVFTCALVANGTVFCWGDNSSNQLGDGGAESIQKVPKQVPGLTNIVAIAAGRAHVCALSVFGTVSCWGDNSRGQIGNNSTQPASSPVGAQGLTNALAVSAGSLFTCATTTFSGAACWGSNSVGELAAKDEADHLIPTAVINSFSTVRGVPIAVKLFGAVAMTTGTQVSGGDRQHACSLQIGGGLTCWGANGLGELGDGTQIDRQRPTVVNSFTANVDPAVTLEQSSRIATVTAFINCPAGAEAHLTLTLTQGDVTGTGQAVVKCADRLLLEPMTIPAHGPNGFLPGAAVATVEALVLDSGSVVEDQHWTRAVILTAQ